MISYALTWRPHTDNLGHDLVALAAAQHLPRIDCVLDAEALDAAPASLGQDDRLVTLVASHFLTAAVHWPPEARIAPACVGVHISAEDAWGVPVTALAGAGLDALRAAAPIAVRDNRTAARLQSLGVDHTITGDITLTLRHADLPRAGIVCCDVPEEVSAAIRRYRKDVADVTHFQPDPDPDFSLRMAAAQNMLKRYASAEMVFTRRLHCAMACLAVGTPVLWLYRPEYEDTARFAPMDGMVRRESIDVFLHELTLHGMPAPWRNPCDIGKVQREIDSAIRDAIRRAEEMPLPLIPGNDAAEWRKARYRLMMDHSAAAIARLENDNYDALIAKFARLDLEDAARDTLSRLLRLPEVHSALQAASLRMQLDKLPPKEQKALRALHRQGQTDTDDLIRQAEDALSTLGWPD